MTQSGHYLALPEQGIQSCFVQVIRFWGICNHHSLFKELKHMRKIVLVAAAAGAALSLAACSEKTEDAATETADSAMADTEANAEAATDTVEGAADAATDTAEEATTDAAPAEEAPAE